MGYLGPCRFAYWAAFSLFSISDRSLLAFKEEEQKRMERVHRLLISNHELFFTLCTGVVCMCGLNKKSTFIL